MSLMTLLDTKNIVRESIEAVSKLGWSLTNTKEENLSKVKEMIVKETLELVREEVKRIFALQYSLINTYYNRQTIKKVPVRYFEETIGRKRALEYFYQHQFIHNNTAVIDEVYEQHDAYKEILSAEDDEKAYRAFLLFIEESIDVLHFVVEYGCYFAEHICFLRHLHEDSSIEDLFNLDSFSAEVQDELKELLGAIDFEAAGMFGPQRLIENSDDKDIIEGVRNLIRVFPFKDWKVYPEDFFNEEKLTQYFHKSIELAANVYRSVLSISCENIDLFNRYSREVFDLSETNGFIHEDFDLFNFSLIQHMIYGCYVAKNWVNMQRQEEDPRYTGKSFGKIIGVKV